MTIVYHYRVPEQTPGFQKVSRCSIISFRLVLVDNSSVLCPIFHFNQRIGYPQFIVYDYPFDIFKLFLFSDSVPLI